MRNSWNARATFQCEAAQSHTQTQSPHNLGSAVRVIRMHLLCGTNHSLQTVGVHAISQRGTDSSLQRTAEKRRGGQTSDYTRTRAELFTIRGCNNVCGKKKVKRKDYSLAVQRFRVSRTGAALSSLHGPLSLEPSIRRAN